jgi:16S rRNA C1402 (ribose-2'-O) methylase RsmI
VFPDDSPVKTRLRNEEIRAALSILAAEDTRAARVLLGDFNATAEELQPL